MQTLNEPLNYQQLHDTLGQFDPAECHGLLCGLLCLDQSLARDNWLQQFQQQSTSYTNPETSMLQNLFQTTYAQLQDDEFSFQLLLPDDDSHLIARVDALSRWCQGFLSGLGLGGMQNTQQQSTELQDFLHDVSQIAQAGLSADDGNESDELAYVEIVEYLRAGVLLVSQELQRGQRTPSTVNRRLH